MTKNNLSVIAAAALMVSCASPEKKDQSGADTNVITSKTDTVNVDTSAAGAVNATGSMNGSNNSGINSSDGKAQKADTIIR